MVWVGTTQGRDEITFCVHRGTVRRVGEDREEKNKTGWKKQNIKVERRPEKILGINLLL